VEIQLPPLRDRKEDIPLLVEHFLEQYCKKYQKNIKSVNAAALNKLKKYQFPGNVRELQHAVERAVILSESEVLQPEDFLLTPMEKKPANGMNFDDYNLDTIEKMVIRKVLKEQAGNVSQAAEELGITRSALYRRLEKYGL
jgi:DNA-binding NtrC family response regulator